MQFLFPGVDAILAEVEPGEIDWIYRLLGSGYIGLGIGMLGLYRKPARQGVFITMLIVMTAFACLTFIIALLTASYRPIPAVLCVWIVALVLLVYAPHADISPADGQSISFQAGARRSLQRPRRVAAQEYAGRPRLDSQPGTEEGEITEKKTIAMRRSEALPNRNELAVN